MHMKPQASRTVKHTYDPQASRNLKYAYDPQTSIITNMRMTRRFQEL
jgi:hypothetical protein